MAGKAAREIREDFLGGRVDPMEVFDDQNEGRRLARAEQHVAKHAKGTLLELGTRQTIEEFRRSGPTEEVAEQDRPLLSLQAQELKLFGNMAPDLLPRGPERETEVSPQQLKDRAVRHGAAVRYAGRLELESSGCIEPVQELVEQPRVADARVADDHCDGALAVGGAAVQRGEGLELARATDQRRQPALFRHLQPGSATDLAGQDVGADRLCLPPDLELAEIIGDEEAVPSGVR